MNNNEHKLVPPQALADGAMDKVAGGEMSYYDRATFHVNNCQHCKYIVAQCPNGGPEGASQAGLSGSSTCPWLVPG